MGMPKLSLSLFYVLSITIFSFSLGQDLPQDYVDAHNVVRAQVGVEPIQWDQELANYATQYANKRRSDCLLLHSHGPYGENLAMSIGEMSGIEAVQMWVDEEQFYDYDSNTCVDDEMCSHYTQVVWRNSMRVGCAKVSCNNRDAFIICSYDPPGNFIGEWPY
ncbi:pathogenesis-related protein 1A-like [Cucurbita moschata]|uniref:Pathogenesis-related protein 1A-like n=1 Tax=Cucurbita moschata TaxID=3662 RepID=A0A6J1EBN4_CUCMO|nr:pathogenesis-related protein 1A-like [Cucurbita moschata]